MERRRNSHDFPLTLGIEMANCVLAEADALVGDAQRAPYDRTHTTTTYAHVAGLRILTIRPRPWDYFEDLYDSPTHLLLT